MAKQTVEETPRIDARAVWRFVGSRPFYLWGRIAIVEHWAGAMTCRLIVEGSTGGVYELTRLETGRGKGMIFFRCPSCGKRARHIYAVDGRKISCRACSGLAYASQQTRQRRGCIPWLSSRPPYGVIYERIL